MLPRMLLLVALPVALAAQAPPQPDAEAQRIAERIRALEREADRLAREARTLLGDLRKFEVERNLQTERLAEAETRAAAAQAALEQTGARIAELEQQREAQRPNLEAQLVDIYKRGRGGYARLLLDADGVRDLGRVMRAVAALVRINERRIAEHRRTLDDLRRQRAALEEETAALRKAKADARQARAAAERAIAARTALIDSIDSRRDLNAQLAGELQVAYDRLRDEAANLAAGGNAEPVAVPLMPFRGALDWPAAGRVAAGFGDTANRAGGSTVRNGIEIAAEAGSPVVAVHGGTVAFADAFTGFGQLVIVDHGDDDYSLYGFLASTSVQRGQVIERGAELGRVGSAPAGPPALYFEIRIDGRSVDPLQWLKPR